MNDHDRKILDDEIRHQRWCRFKVFLWAFIPGWIGISLIISVAIGYFKGYWK